MGGIIPSVFSSYFILFSYHKSTKQGFKWKLTSLSTCRVFEHHPKFNSFAIRWRRSSLIWPRKFPDFRYYNFWKFTIFYLNGQYVHQMKAENILNSDLTQKNTICCEKICKKFFFQNFRLIFDRIFFETQNFRKIFYTTPKIISFNCSKHPKENYMKVW